MKRRFCVRIFNNRTPWYRAYSFHSIDKRAAGLFFRRFRRDAKANGETVQFYELKRFEREALPFPNTWFPEAEIGADVDLFTGIIE